MDERGTVKSQILLIGQCDRLRWQLEQLLTDPRLDGGRYGPPAVLGLLDGRLVLLQPIVPGEERPRPSSRAAPIRTGRRASRRHPYDCDP